MDIWQFQERVTGRLLAWALANIVTGAAMLRSSDYWRGAGVQALSWGAINAAIALFGGFSTAQRRDNLPDPYSPAQTAKEQRNLERILWIAVVMDVGYMLGGWWWARQSRNDFGRGNGHGVIAQGAFLFFFDLIHGLIISRARR
jgi:hypothetical protein